MALPKLNIQTFKHKLTGIDKEITYRPFTVKEQKILLTAKQAHDPSQELDAICQIISMCTNNEVDPKTLPLFDIEDLFLRIRSKSVSDICEIGYKVKDSKKSVKVSIDLNDVKVVVPESHSRKIQITDSIWIYMNYPSIGMIDFNKITTDQITNDDTMIKACFGYAFTEDEVFNDFTEQELDEWIDEFDIKILKKIGDFFNTMPHVYYETEVEIDKDVKEKLVFKSISDFFV